MESFSEEQFEKVCKELEEKDRVAALAHEKGEQAMRLWSIGRSTAQVLTSLVQTHKPHTILELGTSAGYSTIWLARSVKEIGGKVYTMERDPIKFPIAKETFARTSLAPYITLIEGEIAESITQWDTRIDLLFIDANKKGYLKYLRQLEPFLVKGSIVVADNIINRADMLQDYVQYVTTSEDYQTSLLTIDQGVTISTRIT
jgi:predicted O-methyltransferase YrrM